MKKILFLSLLLTCTLGLQAQGKLQNYKSAYLWGQSNRNHSEKGSALSTSDGRTYAMNDVIRRTSSKAIDLMMFYGKLSSKAETGFHLFAPHNPSLTEISYERSGGTIPFRYFEAGSKDPQGDAWIKNWDVRNATKMQKVENVDFDKATYESIAALEVAESYITGPLKEGDIVLFETAASSSNPGKKGLIKIGRVDDDERSDKAGQGAFQKLHIHIKIQR